MSTALPFSDLTYARQYFLDRAQELIAVAGTPWAFAGAACLIEYMAKMKKGGATDQFDFIDFIRDEMPDYGNFAYSNPNRRKQRGNTFDSTTQDLPEQMYYILRCGLLHRFSVVPSITERNNGGRDRSIVMIHRSNASQTHLSKYVNPLVSDAAYFVAEDFIEDIRCVTKSLFLKPANHINILQCLNDCPPIFLF
jgi:hypothetical protein